MRRSSHHPCASLLLGATLLGAPAWAAAGRVPDPVAILPFRNLNADAELDWLRAGMAETLVSDLKKQSDLRLVEREQLDRALQEVTLQQSGAGEVSQAVTVGRMVGARTVVVGGFQRAGDALRLTARFVAVETGVVLDAAKATGPREEIFALQDEIVARLLGETKAAARPPRPKPKSKANALAAYQLYSRSLSGRTVAERSTLLREALAVDPGFVYAQEELAALQERLRQYTAVADAALQKRAVELRAVFESSTAPTLERQQALYSLEASLAGRAQHRALLALGEKLYNDPWPDELAAEFRPRGLFMVFQAYQSLKRVDQALQVGELFLQQFPLDVRYGAVSAIMQALVAQQRQRHDARGRVDEELAALRRDLDHLDHERCAALLELAEHDAAATLCLAVAERQLADQEQRAQEAGARALWQAAQANLRAGRIGAARALAERLMRERPGDADRLAVAKLLRQWPRE